MSRKNEVVERSIRAIENEAARIRAEIDEQQRGLDAKLAPLRDQLAELEDALRRLIGDDEPVSPGRASDELVSPGRASDAFVSPGRASDELASPGRVSDEPASPGDVGDEPQRTGGRRRSRFGRASLLVLLPLLGAAALVLGLVAVRDAPGKPGASIGLVGGVSRPAVLLDGGSSEPGAYLYEIRPSSSPRTAEIVTLPAGGAASLPLTTAPRNTLLRIVLSPLNANTRQRRLGFTLGRGEGPQAASR